MPSSDGQRHHRGHRNVSVLVTAAVLISHCAAFAAGVSVSDDGVEGALGCQAASDNNQGCAVAAGCQQQATTQPQLQTQPQATWPSSQPVLARTTAVAMIDAASAVLPAEVRLVRRPLTLPLPLPLPAAGLGQGQGQGQHRLTSPGHRSG
eukprot:m.488354 g.488354  ORF g.488354 m.488354 type:complete len:150 (+) comp25738_c0_seq1:305-754(+)